MNESLEAVKNTVEPWVSLEYNVREAYRLIGMRSPGALVHLLAAIAICEAKAAEHEEES